MSCLWLSRFVPGQIEEGREGVRGVLVGGGEGRDHVRRHSRELLNAYPDASVPGVCITDSTAPSHSFACLLVLFVGGVSLLVYIRFLCGLRAVFQGTLIRRGAG